MIIAVASGKGGTGKTSVVASLARRWGGPVQVVDLDVEAPNLHLFVGGGTAGRERVDLTVPRLEAERCIVCGACAELCRFQGIVLAGPRLLLFPDQCHGCGGCAAVCPTGALVDGVREIGEVTWGPAGDIELLMGRLRVGEPQSPPLMRAVRAHLHTTRDVLVDAPPGASCPAVTAVSDADAIVLVGEPTPFGLHDLQLAREAFAPLGRPMGVVVNRAGTGDDGLVEWCLREGLPVLAEIPHQRSAAEACARGGLLADHSPEFAGIFDALVERVRALAGKGGSHA